MKLWIGLGVSRSASQGFYFCAKPLEFCRGSLVLTNLRTAIL